MTAAFLDVFAIRTKTDFDVVLQDIQAIAMLFSQNWYRAARCRQAAVELLNQAGIERPKFDII